MRILIVGGGLIGLGVAWECVRKGAKVTLFDSPTPHAASRVGAGLLIPAGGRVSPHHLALRQASADMYGEWIAELETASGCSCGYNPCGTLTVAFDPGAEASVDGLANCLRGLGVKLKRMTAPECLSREPALNPHICAGFYTADHQVDPEKLAEALRQACSRAGVVFVEEAVTEVHSRGVVAGGPHESDGVVVAAGAWTSRLLSLPVYPVKGEVIHLKAHPDLLRHNLVLRREDLYVANRGDGRYVVGATENESGFDTRLTASESLREKACGLVPGFGDAELIDTRVGFRPKVGDGLPILGTWEGLFIAGAHYRNGILLTPITAKLMAELILHQKVPDLMKPFTPCRDLRHRDEKI